MVKKTTVPVSKRSVDSYTMLVGLDPLAKLFVRIINFL